MEGRPEHPQALAKVEELDWDTDCFGFKVARVASLFGQDVESKTRLLERIKADARAVGVRLLTCRVAYRNFTSLHALEAIGFRMADAMNILLWDRRWGQQQRGHDRNADGIVVRELEPRDDETRQALRGLSGTAFSTGRVANDPAFSPAQVARFYERLCESSLNDRRALILVAWMDGRPAGFVLGDEDDEIKRNLGVSLGCLTLIAVDEASAGRGVGRALVRAFLQRMQSRVELVEVGTQIDNYPALNLYTGLGLKLVSSLVTFHLWLPRPWSEARG